MFDFVGPAVLWFASVGFSIWLAAEKNHSWILWGVLSVFFGPIALIAVAGMPTVEDDVQVPGDEVAAGAKPWNPASGPPD